MTAFIARAVGTVMLALAAAATAVEAEPRRVAAHGADFHAAGTLFERAGHYRAFDDEARQRFLSMGGAEQDFAAIEAKRVAALTADTLAERYVRTYRRTRAIELRMAWMRRVIGDEGALDAALREATVEVERPEGGMETLPMTVATARNVVSLSLMAERLAETTPNPALSGGYRVETEGADCPIEPGPVELVRRDALMEAQREGIAVLAGAVGPERIAVVAAEQLYGTVEQGADPRIDMPEAPQTVYTARTGPRMEFRAERGDCAIGLSPGR